MPVGYSARELNRIPMAERENKLWVTTQFKGRKLPRIEVLGMPDDHRYMDPELPRELRSLVDPEIVPSLPHGSKKAQTFTAELAESAEVGPEKLGLLLCDQCVFCDKLPGSRLPN
jgi:hypothetical protein